MPRYEIGFDDGRKIVISAAKLHIWDDWYSFEEGQEIVASVPRKNVQYVINEDHQRHAK